MSLHRVDTNATSVASFTTARSTISKDEDNAELSPRVPLLNSSTRSKSTYSTFSRSRDCALDRVNVGPSASSMSAEDSLHTPSGLNVLAPSPTDTSTPIHERSDPSTDTPSQQQQPSSSFLGFPRRSPAQLLQTLQKYSSYAFSVFAAFHITNTALIPLAERLSTCSNTIATQAASQYLLLTRPYYQSALLEPLVVGIPLLTHIASGIVLRAFRRHVLLKNYGGYGPVLPAYSKKDQARWRKAPWPRLSWQSVAGYAAIPLVFTHSFVTRGLPLVVEGSSSSIGLDYVSHGFAIAPKIHLLAYGVLVAVVGSHIVWGWSKWLGVAPTERAQGEPSEETLERKTRWWAVWGVSAGVVGLWMAGGLGVVGRAGLDGRTGGWVGRVYDGVYRQLPGFRAWV
ncbi:MAG: hypothetical protein Q9162_003139 [Coniocarpon cinnabarinum]